jgi:hypothetical protein
MGKKDQKARARKQARKLMKKRTKDNARQKSRSGVAVSENAVQHQMLSEFGNVENFVKNIGVLAELLRTDDDLIGLRYDVEATYAHFDLAADRDALADLYSDVEDFTYYGEDFQDFWRDKRREALKDLVTEEFVEKTSKIFKKLILTKKGHKREFRASLAGHLLVQSHEAALAPTESPLEDNNLWELIFLATLKENAKELPEPAPAGEDQDGAADVAQVSAEATEGEPSTTEEPEGEPE